MPLAIDITNGRGLSNKVHHELLLKKEQNNAVLAFLFAINSHLTSCTLLTRWSVLVLKVGVTCSFEAYKRRLAYSVTVGISA